MRAKVFAIPGIGGDASLFALVAEALAPDIEIIAHDLPGYGDAPMAERQYGFADLAHRLAAHGEREGVERLNIVGHSIGGMVAQEFALTYPERTASLVLSGTTSFFGSADGSFQKAFLEARLGPLDGGQSMQDLAEDFVAGLLGSEAGPQAAELSQAGFVAVPAAAYRMAIACLVTFNHRNDMGRIAAPCLLIAGDEDPNAPLKTMTRMAEAIPAARLKVLEHTGHMAPFEKPIQFARLMREFYEEIAA
jgi:pimeloyl-ACP methyl ester carboxylesterase